MDFTQEIYKTLLITFKEQNYSFQTFQEFLEVKKNKAILLRHDVDKLPTNSLWFAKTQREFGIKATYYFRITPESFNPLVIEEIAYLGHEIGYHYEDVDIAVKSNKFQVSGIKTIENKNKFMAEKGIELFEKHLKEFRKYYPVKTICMHGSPLSKYDNRLLWKYYDYRNFSIIGEPYFDIDFNDVFYLTDTGRRWDGYKVSVRDKVSHELSRKNASSGAERSKDQKQENDISNLSLHSTQQIIQSINFGNFPEKAMLTFHPQRWTNSPVLWTKELVMQNIKNIIKKYFLVKSN